ncbi:uncharacterized protein LAESUDRAFT_722894 [Laetiporus sulphureus 93-53]|uniref:Uncharacterized protein n=1 Tax=Laetiporus sulphureus 93-53 TaxID=1314785 RepID=A0A165FLS3_9APHY|nr:uncharacterized protein LAESUDRAFT_722894 [Laetiporus sulphureus 93-53]KZT09162.1 hypothetical protein LAESUDRAFT_722894 [Laetiporus sulphureus 93-53]
MAACVPVCPVGPCGLRLPHGDVGRWDQPRAASLPCFDSGRRSARLGQIARL